MFRSDGLEVGLGNIVAAPSATTLEEDGSKTSTGGSKSGDTTCVPSLALAFD